MSETSAHKSPRHETFQKAYKQNHWEHSLPWAGSADLLDQIFVGKQAFHSFGSSRFKLPLK